MAQHDFNKRTRKKVGLLLKKTIIVASEAKPKIYVLAKQFQMPYTTISTILKSRERVREAVPDECDLKRIRLTLGRCGQVDDALVKWLKSARSKNVTINGEILKEKQWK